MNGLLSRLPVRALCLRVGIPTVLVLFWALGATGAGLYPGPRNLTATGGPSSVIFGRFDRDAHVDLVTNAPESGRILVFSGSGTGNFTGPVGFRIFARPVALANLDFDRDGLEDIAWVDAEVGRVGLMVQRPDLAGGFRLESVPGLDEAQDVVVADGDQDGWPDLLVAHAGADALAWYPNRGGVLGSSEAFAVGDGPAQLVRLDHELGQTVAVLQSGYLSRDILTFGLPRPSSELRIPAIAERGLQAIDFDRDGNDELAILESSPARLRWYRGRANQFALAGELPVAAGSTDIALFPEDLQAHRLLVAEESRHRITLWTDDGFGFARAGSWYVGAQIPEMDLQDIDGDGSSEVVIPRPDANVVVLMEPLGDGFLAPWALDTGRDPLRIERYRESGASELLAVLCPGSREIWLYRNENGAVTPTGIVPVDAEAREVAIEDIDGINGPDLLSVSLTGGLWVSRAADGGGYLPPAVFDFGAAPIDLDVVDVVGTSAPDLVVADRALPGLRIYEGDGAGGFVPAGTVPTQQPPVGIASKDLDRNGYTDLVVLGETNQIYLVFNSPGSALVAVPLTVGDAPRDVGFGDFNEDIYPDLIVANAESGSFAMVMSVLPAFYAVIDRDRPTPYGAQNVEVLDFDSDGLDDVLFSSPAYRFVALHRNGGTVGRPAAPSNLPLTIEVSDDPRDLRLSNVDGDSIADILTISLTGDVLLVSRSDPYEDLQVTGASMSAVWEGTSVHIEILSDARWGHDLHLLRSGDGRAVALESVAPGVWQAFDRNPESTRPEYVVRDASGRELDRVAAGTAEPVTGVEFVDFEWIDPRVTGRTAEFRMRAPAGIFPDLKIYDVRGRRVASLQAVPEGDGWFTATWSGTDLRGRPISRGRYLVRATLGDQVFRGSVLLH